MTVTDFLGTDYVAMLRATGVDLPDLETIVVASGPAARGHRVWAAFLARATDADRAEVDRRCTDTGPDDPSDILFTSGTTGLPKGVVMSHGRTLRVATDWVEMTGLCADDRYLMVNPYFHMFGLKAGILACVASGALDAPRGGVRRRPGPGPGRGRAGHRAPRVADRLPVHPRPSRSRAATTCRACGWR